jgi:hypothetical protein
MIGVDLLPVSSVTGDTKGSQHGDTSRETPGELRAKRHQPGVDRA